MEVADNGSAHAVIKDHFSPAFTPISWRPTPRPQAGSLQGPSVINEKGAAPLAAPRLPQGAGPPQPAAKGRGQRSAPPSGAAAAHCLPPGRGGASPRRLAAGPGPAQRLGGRERRRQGKKEAGAGGSAPRRRGLQRRGGGPGKPPSPCWQGRGRSRPPLAGGRRRASEALRARPERAGGSRLRPASALPPASSLQPGRAPGAPQPGE